MQNCIGRGCGWHVLQGLSWWVGIMSFKSGTCSHCMWFSNSGCTGMTAEFSLEKIRRDIFMGESKKKFVYWKFYSPSVKWLSLCLFFYVMKAHKGGIRYGSKRNIDKEKLSNLCAEVEEVKQAVKGYIQGLLERIFGLKMKNREHVRGFCFCRQLEKLFS